MRTFDIDKTRKLIFADDSPAQLEQAYFLLSGLEHMKVERGEHPNMLIVHYSLEHYSLEGLEKALTKEGFHFKEKNWHEILDDLFIHYCEDVQYHNLSTPEHPTKQNQADVFAQAYDYHPHGDRDTTPTDLRNYK